MLVRNKTISGWGYGIPSGKGICAAWSAKDSPCAWCYAQQGRMIMPVAMRNLQDNLLTWDRFNAPALAGILANDIRKSTLPIRWFVSGDFRSIDDVWKTEETLRLLQEIHNKHNPIWIATRAWTRGKPWIDALRALRPYATVRLSAETIDGPTPRVSGFPYSRVVTQGSGCPKQTHGSCNAAGCRRCWDPRVELVEYRLHGRRVRQ